MMKKQTIKKRKQLTYGRNALKRITIGKKMDTVADVPFVFRSNMRGPMDEVDQPIHEKKRNS